MKTLIFILFAFLISCSSSPEKKIMKSFNEDRHSIKRFISAKGIEIYDTIYISQIEKNIPSVDEEIKLLERRIKNMSFYRDSVYKLNHVKFIKDSIVHSGLNKVRNLNIEKDHNRRVQGFYFDLYTDQRKDSICGYYAQIITNKQDTLNFIIRIDFSILCPTFMLEK